VQLSSKETFVCWLKRKRVSIKKRFRSRKSMNDSQINRILHNFRIAFQRNFFFVLRLVHNLILRQYKYIEDSA
jgi:hypothetical protein